MGFTREALRFFRKKIKNNKIPVLVIILFLFYTVMIGYSFAHDLCFGCWAILISLFLVFALILYNRYKSISPEETDKSIVENLKEEYEVFVIMIVIAGVILLYGITKGIPMSKVGMIILPIVLLIVCVLALRYGMFKIKHYKLEGQRLKQAGTVIVVILIIIGTVGALYLEYKYIFTAEGEQRYYIEITQNTSAAFEIILPNLVHESKENVTLDPDKYNVLKGEAEIYGIEDGRFLEIRSSSLNLTLQFKLENYFLHERDLKWDYQWELLEEEEKNGKSKRYMNIEYNSSVNQSCHLTMEWTDEISPIMGGHWYSLEVDERLTDGKNKVYPDIRKWIV